MTDPKHTIFGKMAKAKFLTPFRVILMTALVFYLAFIVYRFFGVTDFKGWLQEVGVMIAVFLAVILAAAAVVALLVLFRKKSGGFKQ